MSNRKVLISILGRSSPKDGEYRKVTYVFPSGAHSAPTAFSGWALRDHVKPDAMIVLGTSGSMWPFLLLDAVAQSDHAERELDELDESSANHAATQQQLDALAPCLGRYLAMDVRLQIVPAGRTQAEQLSLLTAVAEHIREGDKVTLDLTHGFRHQPILLVMAAIYLRTVRSASIETIYSSFFDEAKNEGELFDLSGLLRLIDWTTALAGYEKDGDFGVFEKLLSQDNLSASSLKHLSNAAFLERIHIYTKAFGESRSFANVLEQQKLQGVSGIFQDFLAGQLAPKDEYSPALRLLRRAQKHLRYGDYDRVALVGEVAFLTHFAETGEDPADQDVLDQIKERVTTSPGLVGALWEPYNTMRLIRNTFAHIKPPHNKNTRTIFNNEDTLRRKLQELLKTLEKAILINPR